MKSLLLVLVSAACLAAAGPLRADDSWIHGIWWYADADGLVFEGDDKDGMVFKPDGSVDLVDEFRRPYLNCVYSNGIPWELSVKCVVRGEVKELTFRVGDDRDKLSAMADPDGGGYVRS